MSNDKQKHGIVKMGNGTLPAPIDRRGGKNKSIGNRERFLRRHKDQIREAVKRAVDGRDIRDIEGGEEIRIPKRDISEPVFGHGPGGKREMVHPGNKEYVPGDRIARPKGGSGGSGKGQASDSGEGDDDFVFHLTKEEFMQIFFDDLALPNMERTVLAETPEFMWRRAGIVTDGTPANLHRVRTFRAVIGRKIAWGDTKNKKELERLGERLAVLEAFTPSHQWESEAVIAEIVFIREEIRRLLPKANRVHIDPLDLRFRGRVKTPIPIAKAVMFCLMDVSGSMDEQRKDLAKRFFILLYLFLTRHYEKIDIVFIRHHTEAKEVDEQNFFHATETGGTVVSSALELMLEIINARYPRTEWNIYGAQSSDGDNWHHDSGRCSQLLRESILPLCRYYAYMQVAEEEQNLWEEYSKVADSCKHFAMRKATETTHIYPVFRELFKKEGVTA